MHGTASKRLKATAGTRLTDGAYGPAGVQAGACGRAGFMAGVRAARGPARHAARRLGERSQPLRPPRRGLRATRDFLYAGYSVGSHGRKNNSAGLFYGRYFWTRAAAAPWAPAGEKFETGAGSLLAGLHGQLRLVGSSAAAQAGRCAPAAPAAEAHDGRGSLDTLFRTGEVL